MIISEVCTFACTQDLKNQNDHRMSLKSVFIEFNVNLHTLGEGKISDTSVSIKFTLTNYILTEFVNLTKDSKMWES